MTHDQPQQQVSKSESRPVDVSPRSPQDVNQRHMLGIGMEYEWKARMLTVYE